MRAVSVLAGGEVKRNNGAGDDSSICLYRSELATGEPARPRLEVYIKAQTTKHVNSHDCNSDRLDDGLWQLGVGRLRLGVVGAGCWSRLLEQVVAGIEWLFVLEVRELRRERYVRQCKRKRRTIVDQLTANVLYHAIKLIKHLWKRSAAADKVRVERLGLQQEKQHVREYDIVIRRRRRRNITIARIVSKRVQVSGGQLGLLDG
jgi:hypothetical protein